MKRIHIDGWDDRYAGGNGRVLQRFLRRQVGRLWDKIYSEICEVIDNSVRKQVDSYLKYHVAKEIKMIGGLPYEFIGDSFRGSGYLPMTCNSRYISFYVNPDTGLLGIAPPESKYPKQSTYIAYKHPTDPLIQYHQIDGIWYEVQFRDARQEEKNVKQFGRLVGRLPEYTSYYSSITRKAVKTWVNAKETVFKLQTFDMWYELYYMTGGYLFPLSKRQLNKREIKQLKNLKQVF